MNHRFLLRLSTSAAVWLLLLSCIGIVLWVIDEILGWDILPDAWSLLIRALLIAGGIITFVLVVMNIRLSLALLAEASASRAQLPDYSLSRRLKRRIRRGTLGGLVAIALLIGGLQVVNQVRAQASIRAAQVEFDQTQTEMDQSMGQVLGLFTPPLLEALETNTLAEAGQLGNLTKLFRSIQASFPHQPTAAILVPASQPPYQYARIDAGAIAATNQGQLTLSPQLYTGFPTEQETQAIQQLFAGQAPALDNELRGTVINNTLPSSWGVLKRNDQIMAVVYLQSNSPEPFGSSIRNQTFHHDGPDQLLTN